MSSYDYFNDQLHDYYSFSISLVNFLHKYLLQFEKALFQYSIILKTLQKKSTKLFAQTKKDNPLKEHLSRAFLSFIQTIEDEYHQFEQRAQLIHLIENTVKNLHQQIHSSDLRKEKKFLQKYTSRLTRRSSRYEYFRKHHQMTLIWKDHLDIVASQTTNLLWKLFSYSQHKFHVKLPAAIEIASGDQSIPNSNNAFNPPSNSTHSTEIDEIMIKQNQDSNDLIDDDDDDEQWINLVKENAILQRNECRSLHLSELSYTTECSSQ